MGFHQSLLLHHAIGLLYRVGVHRQQRRQHPPGGQLLPVPDGPGCDPLLDIADDLLVDGYALRLHKGIKLYHGIASFNRITRIVRFLTVLYE